MNNLQAIVEQIRNLPSSGVDINFRQGRVEFRQQLNLFGQVDESFINDTIEQFEEIITTLKQNALPYKIPEEYIFFLEFYGGLYIDGDDGHYFSTYGLGPMSEEWYASIISPDAVPESIHYGFLALGSLSFYEGKYNGQLVKFFLDLAGTIQESSVIGIGPLRPEGPLPSMIIKNVNEYPQFWHKVADSFTHWLQRAAETQGAFDYV